jgi:hypothetical protein
MMGYGLEVTGFLRSDGTALAALPPAPPPAA